MNLFISHQPLYQADSNILILPTPIGELFFNCEWANGSIAKIAPTKVEQAHSSLIISSWSFDYCLLEFLRLKFIPTLPIGMKVDQCFSCIWRIKVFKEMSFNFKCYLNTSNLQASPESGEGFIAQSFENNEIKLTVSTEDEEEIQNRAQTNDWMPFHFRSEIKADHIRYLTNGLEVYLSHLMKAELAQIHFNIAWTSLKNPEVSTWYAVDESVRMILKESGID